MGGQKKFCPRCTLEYLSFYFASQAIDAVKIDCAKIIFNFIENKDLRKIIKLTTINAVVDKKFDKESVLINKRKNQNQRFNLFIIANEILKISKQNPIGRRRCKLCSRAAFHLIKVPCCEKLMCISCISAGLFTKKDTPKCRSCKNECLCRSVHEFSKMFKSTCVAIREICSLEITKNKEKEWENEIIKIKKSKRNGNMRMQFKKFAETVNAHEHDALNMIAQNSLLDVEIEINEKPVTKSRLKFNLDDIWNGILDAGIVILQLKLCPLARADSIKKWVLLNTLSAHVIASFLLHNKIYVTTYRSKEVNTKIMKTCENFNALFLSMINCLFMYLFYGPKFCESFLLIPPMIMLVPLTSYISQIVSKYIHRAAIHESFYDFY